MASQRDQVADLLRTYGGLTIDGARRHGIGQVRTRILELRRAGWQIDTCTVAGCHPYGGSHYLLVQAPDEAPRQMVLL